MEDNKLEEINNYETLVNNYESILPNIRGFYNEVRNVDSSIEQIKKTLNALKSKDHNLKPDDYETTRNSVAYLYQFYLLRVQDTKAGFEAFRERIASFVDFLSRMDPSSNKTETAVKPESNKMTSGEDNIINMNNSSSNSPIPTFV